MKLQSLELEITRTISEATKWCWEKRRAREWTFCLKKSLVNLGHKHKFKVCAAPNKKLRADYPEWLYDLSWIIEGKTWKILKGVKLIVEIEWSNNPINILSDFQKLTVGLADLRLMITSYREGAHGEAHLEKLVNQCKKTCPKSRKFRYLFLGVPDKHPENIKQYVWIR